MGATSTEVIILIINSVIALCVLMIAIKQRKDSMQVALVGAITLINGIKTKENDKLQILMSLSKNKKLIDEMSVEVRKQTLSDVEKQLHTLHKLDLCYNDLVSELDKALNQKGVLERAIRKQKDTDYDKTIEIFKSAYKL